MPTTTLNEIERRFAELSHEAQLSLLERLVHRVRVGLVGNQSDWETNLSVMAADPEMQRELNHANEEFSATEADGLGRD